MLASSPDQFNTIRPAARDDIPGINQLFEEELGQRRDERSLRWVLENPQSGVNGFVGVRDNRVVGFMGYVPARYLLGHEMHKGVHPILWCASAAVRGTGIATALYQKVLDLEGISLIFEGTARAKSFYPKLGYRYIASYPVFTNHLAIDAKSRTVLKVTGLLFSSPMRFISRRIFKAKAGDSFRLEETSNVTEAKSNEAGLGFLAKNRAQNAPDKATLQWLKNCPDLQCHMFRIYKGEHFLGPLIVYQSRENPAAARIVFHPALSEKLSDWTRFFADVDDRLKSYGIKKYSILATESNIMAALLLNGALPVGSRKIWLRDPKGLADGLKWHVTFIEGDASFRGI